jgi:hypothetical protein
MTYLLLVVACLAGNPSDCREERIAMPEITNATACYLGGQVMLRDWTRGHKGWRLTNARCLERRNIASAHPQGAP